MWYDHFVLNQKKKVITQKENGDNFTFENQSEEDLCDFAKKYGSGLNIEADGPYGDFKKLNDVDILLDLAEVAPNATLNAFMSCNGHMTFDTQEIEGYLHEGLLYIDTYCEDSSADADDFITEERLCYDPVAKKYIDPGYAEDDEE